ncbi:sugar MFS transporter [Pseudochryseolinea flava]|uniref:Glucose/galactose MFS transporter n=1 Tax=Pseudochryseolinea flava TaxID=2059302 RepID=A0A364Y6F2_9BACT|nr:sugar MFS transporter [Pseudochryseolinea flava]RAW02676.1 glucose/galactose MFS transporter [Pseudochryseolinea flava]
MTNQKNSYAVPMIIIGSLFFIFGFVTWLNGPLITFVKLAFNLQTDGEAFWVTTAFYMSYFVLALPSSWILEKTGMKKGMALGLLVMAIGTFLFGHFATARNYHMSLFGLFVIGSGLTFLQAASNPYISIIGPIESAAQRISIMGICNKIAGILSPIIIGAFVLTGVDEFEKNVKAATDEATREALLNEFAAKIYTPYMIMAGVLVLLAFWILKSGLPEIKASEVNQEPVGTSEKGKTSLFQFPHVLLGALCLFLYVGVEVIAGDAIGTYGKGFNIPSDETKYFTSYTLGAMLVGYLIGLFTIPKYLSQANALKFSAISGVIFTIAAVFTQGYTSVIFVALLGLSNALMWPAIWPLAISGLGKFTEKGSALLIMGIAGGAVIPKIFAEIKTDTNFQMVFLALMLPCYLFILYYGSKGYLVGKTSKA